MQANAHFPETGVREIKSALRMDKNIPDIDCEGSHQKQQNEFARFKSQLPQQEEHQGPQKIELLLYPQRPQVKEGLGLGRAGKVS